MKSGGFLSGVALGLFGGLAVGFFLGSHASGTIRGKIAAQTAPPGPTIQVVCAAADLPSGHVISRPDLAKKQVFESAVPADRCIIPGDAPRILGRKLLFSVKRGDPILWPDIQGGPARADETEENQQQIAP